MYAYLHYNNHQLYMIKGYTLIQVEGTWEDATIYYNPEDPSMTFVRPTKEFDEKFTKVSLAGIVKHTQPHPRKAVPAFLNDVDII